MRALCLIVAMIVCFCLIAAASTHERTREEAEHAQVHVPERTDSKTEGYRP
jgi:hypothetical protein